MDSSSIGSTIETLDRSCIIVAFDPGGTIRTTNDTFARIFGYPSSKICGHHRRVLGDRVHGHSLDEGNFWDRLRGGACMAGTLERCDRNGRMIAIHAAYFPLSDHQGRVVEIIEIATIVGDEAQRGGESGPASMGGHDALFEALRLMITDVENGSSGMRADMQSLTQSWEEVARRSDLQAMSLARMSAVLAKASRMAKTSADKAGQVLCAVAAASNALNDETTIVRRANHALGASGQTLRDLTATAGRIEAIALRLDGLAFGTDAKAPRREGSTERSDALAGDLRDMASGSAEATQDLRMLLLCATQQIGHCMAIAAAADRSLARRSSRLKAIDAAAAASATAATENAATLEDLRGSVEMMELVARHSLDTAKRSAETHRSMAADIDRVSDFVSRLAFDCPPVWRKEARPEPRPTSPSPKLLVANDEHRPRKTGEVSPAPTLTIVGRDLSR